MKNQLSKQNILFVSKTSLLSKATELALNALPYNVLLIVDDELGLNTLLKNDIHLIIINYDELKKDSFRIVEQIKNYTGIDFIPIMLYGKDISDDEVQKGIAIGIDDFFVSLHNAQLLIFRIRKLLDQSSLEKKYCSLLSNSDVGMCFVQLIHENEQIIDANILQVNNSFSKIFNLKNDPLIENMLLSFLSDTNIDFLSLLKDCSKDERGISREVYSKKLNCWLFCKAYELGEDIIGIVVRDISEEKQLALKLDASRRNYKLLFENMNNAFSVHKIITNNNGEPIDYEFVDANSIVLERFGVPKEELIGKRVKNIFPNIEPKWLTIFGRVALSGKSESFIGYSADFNRYYDVHVYSPKKLYFATTFADITEKIEIEKSLKESEAKYRIIADNISDWVWKSDLELNFSYSSPAVEQIRGLTVEEALKEKLEDAFPQGSIDIARDKIAQHLQLIIKGDTKGWDPVTVELQLYKKNKERIWVQIKARFMKGSDGMPAEIIGVARDITKQKNAEIALSDNEKRYRMLFENASDPVILMKGDQYIECNQTTLDVLGFKSKSDFLKQKPWDISPKIQPDGSMSRAKAKQAMQEVYEKGHYVFEWVHAQLSGKPIWFHISMAKVTIKGEILIYMVWHDITSSKVVEIALKESEEKYRLIADNISDLVWKTNLNLDFTYLSPSIFTIRGYTPEEAMNHCFSEIVIPEDASRIKMMLASKLEEIKQGDKLAWDAVVFDLRMYKKDKSVIWVQVSARFIKGDDGLPKEIIGVSRDITSQKNAELALFDSQNDLMKINKDKDRFISILSHDLIGTMGSSIQLIEMLDKKGATWEKRDEFVNYLTENTKSSYNLLIDLVRWGKASLGKEQFNPVSITVKDLVQKIIELYHTQTEQKNIIIINESNENLEAIVDENMLETILRNLIKNAIKYSFHQSAITINVTKKENVFLWAVKDEGVGMSKEAAANLFNLKSIKSIPGTEGELGNGLGLQIVKEYVLFHGGDIWVESNLSKGTTIFFTTQHNSNR